MILTDCWRYVIPGLCSIVLFALDVSLYRVGLSWTPFHYESLAPMLAFSAFVGRWRWVSATAALLVFGTTSLLFFSFRLSWQLATESWLFVAGTVLMGSLWIAPVAVGAWQNRRASMTFLVMMSALTFVDKMLCHDMLLASYTPHFFRLQSGERSTQSHNSVYSSLNAQLVPGKGAVLIVFESLGVPEDNTAIFQLQREFPDFVFDAHQSEGGSTLSAEIRYLCDINGTITNYKRCLPHRLRSYAVHGNALSYFNRDIIYPAIGFQEFEGRQELVGLLHCSYSYNAICDVAIWDRLINKVLSSDCHEFNYFLSIDSHFPYRKYTHHVEGLYGDLRELLIRLRHLRQRIPTCPIYIAGDHPPPLAPAFKNQQVLIVSSK
jgi:hypothetical protein